MISKEEVEHIAKLARLELTDAEIQKMQKDLSEILDYFNLLKKAPLGRSQTGEAKPEKTDMVMTKNTESSRKDEVGSSEIADKLVAQSPDKKDGYIKVKAIL